jgi:predicted CopG family antitoxin
VKQSFRAVVSTDNGSGWGIKREEDSFSYVVPTMGTRKRGNRKEEGGKDTEKIQEEERDG